MSKTIWKYILPKDGATIQIHEHIVEVLHIAAQDGVPTLWAIVDPDRPRDGYTEVVAWGTGWPLPDDVYHETDYWGTCGDGYGYIWHYFAAARFDDLWYADKVTTDRYNGTSVGSPDFPYSLTISGDCISSGTTSAADWTIATLNDTARTATVTLDNTKIDLSAFIDKIAEGVANCATATNSAYR